MSSHKTATAETIKEIMGQPPECEFESIAALAKQAVENEAANPGEKLYVGKQRPKVEIRQSPEEWACGPPLSSTKTERTIIDRIDHIREEVADLNAALADMHARIAATIG